MNRRFLILAMLPTIMLFFSCKRELTRLSLHKKKLEINEYNFEYLKAKSRISLIDEKGKTSATANIRVKKDSLIWLSLSAFGIEGARGLITRDSLMFVDRLNKAYYVYTFDDLSKRFNFKLNYDIIQAMLLGEMPLGLLDSDLVKRTETHFIIAQNEGEIEVINYISRTNQKVEKVEMTEKTTNNQMTLNYGDFQLIDDFPFPFSSLIFLQYTDEGKEVHTKLDISFQKAEQVGHDLNFPFNIPQKYERK